MAYRHILLPLAALAAAACSDSTLSDSGPIPVSMSVAPDSLVVRLGQTASVAPTVLDARGQPITSPRIRFASSRPEIVTVDSLSGVATAVAAGTARITVIAQPVQSIVPVTVLPSGGGEVASITLDSKALTLETWSLAPQAIRYRAVNAEGESLCGLIPITVQADTAAFSARLAGGGDPCLIMLTPVSERSGWLRIQAGAKRDSARVTVHHTRYRWAFDLPSGTHPVRTTVEASVAVWNEDGKPAQGVTVHFEMTSWDETHPDSSVDVVTGQDGSARVSIVLPRSTYQRWTGVDSLAVPPAIFRVNASIPTAGAQAESELLVVAGPPHHIKYYVHVAYDYSICTPLGCYVEGTRQHAHVFDSRVGIDSYYNIQSAYLPAMPCSEFFPYCEPPIWLHTMIQSRWETLVAAVVDEYENVTDLVPSLVENGSDVRVETVRGYVNGTLSPCCTWGGYPGGKVAVTNVHYGPLPQLVTFTAPGIGPESIQIDRY